MTSVYLNQAWIFFWSLCFWGQWLLFFLLRLLSPNVEVFCLVRRSPNDKCTLGRPRWPAADTDDWSWCENKCLRTTGPTGPTEMQPGGKLEISSFLVHLKSDISHLPLYAATFSPPNESVINGVYVCLCKREVDVLLRRWSSDPSVKTFNFVCINMHYWFVSLDNNVFSFKPNTW